MAFGSATITRTRTTSSTSRKRAPKSRTRTESAGAHRTALVPPSDSESSSSNASAASSSSTSERVPPRPRAARRTSAASSDESDDPDFGSRLAKATAREVKAQLQADRERERRARLKEYRDRGEEVPEELKKRLGGDQRKEKGSRGRSVGTKEKEMKPEIRALLMGIEPGRGRPDDSLNKHADKGKGKAVDSTDSEDEDDESVRPTKPTFDWARKKKETEKRNRIRLDSVFFEAGAVRRRSDSASPPPRGVAKDFDEAYLIKHLERRWVHKSDPLSMSSERAALEERLNPLLRLLNVNVTVVEDGEEADSSTSASDSAATPEFGSSRQKSGTRRRSRPDATYVVRGVDTDDEDGGESGALDSNGDDGHDMNRLGSRNASVISGDQASERNVGPWSRGRPDEAKAQEYKSKSFKYDNGDEVDIKPKVEDLEEIGIGGRIERDDAIDLEEPETEPSDIDNAPSRPFVTIKAEEPLVCLAAEVKRQEDLLQKWRDESRLGSQSQSRSQSESQVTRDLGSTQALVPPFVDTSCIAHDEDEEEGDVDEQTLRMLKQQEAKQRLAEEKRARRERKARQMQDGGVSGSSRVKEEARNEGIHRRGRAEPENVDEAMEDGGDDDDFAEEPAAWEVVKTTVDKRPKVTLPYSVKKGRPKFVIQTLEQHRTGPHLLNDEGAQIPASINKFLRPYQREGVDFLWGQWKKRLGGILGDDMGLGKTIQVIAFLAAVMEKKGLSRLDADRRKNAINALDTGVDSPTDLGPTCLIACPASVRNNWEREFRTWGYFDVAVYEGTKEQRARTMERFKRGYVDVLIAGMESVRDQIDDFSRLDITLLIIDEAHRLKNPKSSLTQAFHQFPTPHRYGLTGTAIQNDLDEMWCILNYANPGHVGVRRQWQDLITRPLKHAQKKEATASELALGRSRASALVGILLPHFWLRRTKESVQLQLPRKRDNIVLCPLTDLQKDVYRRILGLEEVKLILSADDPCECGEKDPEGLPYRKGACCHQGWTKLIFKYIVLFQKISNHLALIYPDRSEAESNGNKYQQDLVWSKAAFPDDYQKRKPGRTAFADPQLCGKWKVLCELLELWYKNGDKVLIFSMSLKVLDLLSELMETTHYNYLVLDGKTPAETRMDLVDEFNDPNGDKFAFLISTRAGGVGLNLKAANKVVIFDPNWNPSHDLQAMDRSHRFGQTKEVDVYRLVGAGTLEELILNRQQYKRAQASVGYDATSERRLYSGVQGEGKQFAGELWGVKNIFKFSEHISLTEKSIRQMQLEEIEYARNAELEDGDSAPSVPDYDDESHASGIVAEVTGLKAKNKNAKKLDPGELERRRKHEEEHAKIASILGGRITVQSDSVLGGSRVEEYRSREALKAAAGPRRSTWRQQPPRPSKRRQSHTEGGRGNASDSDDDGEVLAYDPARRANKLKKARK